MIRSSIPADVPALLDLVRELAAYERAADQVEATEADLTAALFGTEPRVWALVAEDGGQVVGMAVYFLSYSTWTGRPGLYLEDLYVQPHHRRRGTGRALMAALAQRALEAGCARFEWSVLDWNQSALIFYRSLGAEAMAEWTTLRLSGTALGELATWAESPS